MKKHVKGLALCLTVVLILNLSGCWNWRELNSLAIVLGIGIDKAEAPDKYELTAQIVKDKAEEASSSKTSKNPVKPGYLNIRDTGNDIFAIVRDCTHKTSRKLYIAHNQIIVIGESLAEQGVRDCLDLFMRDHETRMTTYVLIAKGKAYDLLNVEPTIEKTPATEVFQLMQSKGATSESVELKLSDIVSNLTSGSKSMVAPYVDIVTNNGEPKIALTGSAVFKDDRLVGELDNKQTRGYLWAIGKVKSGIVNINVLDEEAGIEIKKASSKIIPQISSDGSVRITIKVSAEGALGTQTGTNSLNSVKNTEAVEKAFTDAIRQEMQETLEHAREMGTDIYGFGDWVNKKYPKEWKAIEGNWDKLFKELDVEIDVTSKLRGGGRIVSPVYPEKELTK